METLTQRQEAILKGIVDTHIETSEPVGSRSITQRYALALSPATIRNEMGVLEEIGYLTHPHTSSGRIPTDDGYRYYLDHSTFEEDLTGPVRERVAEELNPHHPAAENMEVFLDRVSFLLSSVTQEVGLSLAAPWGRDIEQKIDALTLSLQGLTNMLEKPEFHDVKKLRTLLKTLEEKIALKQLLFKKAHEARVSVSIGHEHEHEALEDCSIVTARYSVGGQAAGVIAILGPKRMPYRQVIPFVSRVANIMSGFYENEGEKGV